MIRRLFFLLVMLIFCVFSVHADEAVHVEKQKDFTYKRVTYNNYIRMYRKAKRLIRRNKCYVVESYAKYSRGYIYGCGYYGSNKIYVKFRRNRKYKSTLNDVTVNIKLLYDGTKETESQVNQRYEELLSKLEQEFNKAYEHVYKPKKSKKKKKK